ncbi:MAG: glycosyltransferase family A protein [Thiobacillaceae bacterium]
MSSSQPIVSIGMPVFNGERYIRDALDSLLAQTFTDFELIISDNASTDRTEQICRQYAAHDARIRYVRQSVNLGALPNFQFVLEAAVGEYFMWAAYDDFWKPNFIAHALPAMNDKSVGFVFPTTIVKSIHLGVYKKIPRTIFKGFEDRDRNRRILSFANLHIYSYKGNLIYSLFRTNILREAFAKQDISNETIFCMFVLGAARGVVMDEYNFYKRYPTRWPGVRRRRPKRLEKRLQFEKWRDENSDRAKSLFPELSAKLDLIRSNQEPANFHSGFQIVKDLLKPDSAE